MSFLMTRTALDAYTALTSEPNPVAALYKLGALSAPIPIDMAQAVLGTVREDATYTHSMDWDGRHFIFAFARRNVYASYRMIYIQQVQFPDWLRGQIDKKTPEDMTPPTDEELMVIVGKALSQGQVIDRRLAKTLTGHSTARCKGNTILSPCGNWVIVVNRRGLRGCYPVLYNTNEAIAA